MICGVSSYLILIRQKKNHHQIFFSGPPPDPLDGVDGVESEGLSKVALCIFSVILRRIKFLELFLCIFNPRNPRNPRPLFSSVTSRP